MHSTNVRVTTTYNQRPRRVVDVDAAVVNARPHHAETRVAAHVDGNAARAQPHVPDVAGAEDVTEHELEGLVVFLWLSQCCELPGGGGGGRELTFAGLLPMVVRGAARGAARGAMRAAPRRQTAQMRSWISDFIVTGLDL
jgi:hypothetical protein